MFNFQSKLKRQIEILGLCLSDHLQKPIKIFDIADYFQVEVLTIKRDLQDLRSYGIDIHSNKKSGICIEKELSKEKLIEFIFHYVKLNHNDYALDKSTALLVEKRGVKALSNIVMLQLCIDNSLATKIYYNKMGTEVEEYNEIHPLLILQNEGSWRLLAGSGGKIKQYLVDKIVSVLTTGKRFDKEEYKFSDLFKHSWKSWLGDEKHNVKLWLSPYWAERVTPKMFVVEQKIEKNKDQSIIFECTVNSLAEIASWIVSRGKGVKVIEPIELQSLVISLAKETLSNYQ